MIQKSQGVRTCGHDLEQLGRQIEIGAQVDALAVDVGEQDSAAVEAEKAHTLSQEASAQVFAHHRGLARRLRHPCSRDDRLFPRAHTRQMVGLGNVLTLKPA